MAAQLSSCLERLGSKTRNMSSEGDWIMTADITFQYPPELFNLLVDAIPVLNKSKRDVLLFFQGAGVPADLTNDLSQRLQTDANSVGK